MISVKPITPEFVAEVSNVDLSAHLGDEVFSEIEEAFERYAVLVFHKQPLTEEQQLAFAKRFGELEVGADEAIEFPEGILGFDKMRRFCLVDSGDDTLILVCSESVGGAKVAADLAALAGL